VHYVALNMLRSAGSVAELSLTRSAVAQALRRHATTAMAALASLVPDEKVVDVLRHAPAVQRDRVLDRVALAGHHEDVGFAVELGRDRAGAKHNVGGHHRDHRREHPDLVAQSFGRLAHLLGGMHWLRSPRLVS
jgi:hypothetical protein